MTVQPAIRVLFVDDDLYDNEETQQSNKLDLLRGEGDLVVDVAKNGTDALHALRASQYDVIILDIMMPPGEELKDRPVRDGYRTGFIVLEDIRNVLKLQTPIIVLTIAVEPIPPELRDRLHIAEVIAKPIAMKRLAEVIRTCGPGKEATNGVLG